MQEDAIHIKKSVMWKTCLVIVVLALLTGLLFNFKTKASFEDVEAKDLEKKFAILNNANSNSCGGTFNYVDSMPDGARIQGSCCGPMNFHRYREQIHGLEKYSEIEKIPQDPYDVPADSAKELLDYQKNIKLNNEQQERYDEAAELSHEGGPCCCKCWHWYAYEGLAKYLITEYDFTAEQIADLWDLSDACGGPGHADHG